MPATATVPAHGAALRAALASVLCVGALAAPATPASAHWSTIGGGSGAGATAAMPAATAPTGSVAAQSVTIAWTQSMFFGARLGSYSGGGYLLKRYSSGGTTPMGPSASCAGRISGTATALQCVETGVPYGIWRYSVTPVLYSFTGDESPKSATVAVATTAPTLSSVTAQNPASGHPTGAIQASWSAVAGATGYNVYRRTTGPFDYTTPLNGATPITATSYIDPGSGLSGATTYRYVVRAVAGSPAAESTSSIEQTATAVSRPAPPAGVTATAVPAARVNVAWSSVAGVIGYNVYRRISPASYNFSTPLNGATPVASTTYLDTTSANGTSYRYTVRAVITGAGGVAVESLDATESAAVAADGVAPGTPTAAFVNSGGNLWNETSCGVSSGTRYINLAGETSVAVSATIAAPEVGQTVVFSATTTGSTPVTQVVGATGTSVATTMNLSSLVDGPVAFTARTMDLAGNLSDPRSPANAVIVDTLAPSPPTATYSDPLLFGSPNVSGTSECRASIIAVRVGRPQDVYSTIAGSTAAGNYNVVVSGSFLGLSSVQYSVTATDRAGNTGAAATT